MRRRSTASRDATQGVKHLYDKVLRQFPEVAAYVSEHNADLPYLVVGAVADWLESVTELEVDPAIVQRIVDFDRWCLAQPRGETADDDIMTIEIVALRERLFKHDKLLALVPKIMTREELLQNRKCLTVWVGADRYQAALRLCGGVE